MRFLHICLILVQMFVAVGAIPSGILYLLDPTGGLMHQTSELIVKSPFSSFLVPGLFLLFVIGIGNLLGAILTWIKQPFSHKFAMILGLVLCLWIIIQIQWIAEKSFLQPLLFGIGVLEFVLGFLLWKKSRSKN